MSGIDPVTYAGLVQAGEKARTAVVQRDLLIAAAVRSGQVSQREVARAVGLSHTAIQRIVAKVGQVS